MLDLGGCNTFRENILSTTGWRGALVEQTWYNLDNPTAGVSHPLAGIGSDKEGIKIEALESGYNVVWDNGNYGDYYYFPAYYFGTVGNQDSAYGDTPKIIPVQSSLNFDLENGSDSPAKLVTTYVLDTGEKGVLCVGDAENGGYAVTNYTFTENEEGIDSVNGEAATAFPTAIVKENNFAKGTAPSGSLDLGPVFAAVNAKASTARIYMVGFLKDEGAWGIHTITVKELNFSADASSQTLEQAEDAILSALDAYAFTDSKPSSLQMALEAAVTDEQIEVSWPGGCAVQPAMGGCQLEDGTVLIDGVEGEAVGGLLLKKGSDAKSVVFQKTLKPAMETYTFASTSKDEDFLVLDDAVLEYSGAAEVVKIPEGIATVDAAFLTEESKKAVRMLVLPEGMTGPLVYGNFSSLPNLEIVILPESLTDLASSPDGAAGIEGNGKAFAQCIKLKYVRISSKTTQIPEGTFEKCPLVNLNIPSGLESIGSYNPMGESGKIYGTFVLPPSVKYLGSYSFNPETTEVYVTNPDVICNAVREGIEGHSFPFRQVLASNGTIYAGKGSKSEENYTYGREVTADVAGSNAWMTYGDLTDGVGSAKGKLVYLEDLNAAQSYIMAKALVGYEEFSNASTGDSLLGMLKTHMLNDAITLTADSVKVTAATTAAEGRITGSVSVSDGTYTFKMGLDKVIAKLTESGGDPEPTPDPTPDPDPNPKPNPDIPATGGTETTGLVFGMAVMAAAVLPMVSKKRRGLERK